MRNASEKKLIKYVRVYMAGVADWQRENFPFWSLVGVKFSEK